MPVLRSHPARDPLIVIEAVRREMVREVAAQLVEAERGAGWNLRLRHELFRTRELLAAANVNLSDPEYVVVHLSEGRARHLRKARAECRRRRRAA